MRKMVARAYIVANKQFTALVDAAYLLTISVDKFVRKALPILQALDLHHKTFEGEILGSASVPASHPFSSHFLWTKLCAKTTAVTKSLDFKGKSFTAANLSKPGYPCFRCFAGRFAQKLWKKMCASRLFAPQVLDFT